MTYSIYLYPWDLAEEGVETVASRVRAAGLGGVRLAMSYHAGKFLRPHGPGGKVYFPEDGTVYFRPEPSRYGRIKPVQSRLAGEFGALEALAAEAPDLEVMAWTVCLHNTPLGMAYPDLVTRNAYGDPFWPNLCPSAGDARDYIVALCADIAERDGVKALALETPGWLPFAHGYHHEFALVELNPWVETLLGLCFCEHCRVRARGAGLDLDGLARRTRDAVDRFLGAEIAPTGAVARDWLAADLVADPELAAFLRWRCETVAALVREVRAAVRKEVEVRVIPSVQSPNALAWSEGSDLALLAAAADALEVPAYQTGPAAIRDDVFDVRRRAGEAARIGFILRPSYPNLRSATEVAEAVQVVRAAGPDGIAFYNYGHVRLQALDWIRDALAAGG
jgi:hypothetical protein